VGVYIGKVKRRRTSRPTGGHMDVHFCDGDWTCIMGDGLWPVGLRFPWLETMKVFRGQSGESLVVRGQRWGRRAEVGGRTI
jgi:hypothetical protein